MNAGATTEQWQTVPAASAPCARCTPAAFLDDEEFKRRYASVVTNSTEYLRLLEKWGKAEELASEWRQIALAMRAVNVQLVEANQALIAEAQGLRVAA